MKTMKWTRRLMQSCAVILTLGLQHPLHAAISIISSSVSVQGRAAGNTYSGANNGSVTGTTGDGSTWEAVSSGSITPTGASLNATSRFLSGAGDGWWSAGYSQVSVTSVFQPLTPNITFKFTGSTGHHALESWINYTLTDLTASTLVQSASWKYEVFSGWTTQDILPYTANLTLNVNHQYHLQLHARSEIGDFRQGYANLNLKIVPEPAPAGLLAIALAGTIFRRSRRQA
jgi:hypothetical protein